MLVPLKLHFVPLEEVLLGNGGAEIGHVENLDRRRLTLGPQSIIFSTERLPLTLRSGINVAIEFVVPGDSAKSETPSTRSLFHTVPKFPLS